MGEPQGERNAFYRTADLVVALEHADLVVATLEDLGVDFTEAERSDDLGLALLRLNDEDTANRIAAKIEERTEQEQAPHARTALDRDLTALRDYFAARYAGWTPTLGKNRLVGRVEGAGETGQIGHGGESDPEPPTGGPRPRPRMAHRPGLGARVAVLDTAVFAHPDLEGRCIGSPADFLDDEPESSIGCHGTFVTGLVLSMAPGCTVEVRKVLGEEDGAAESWDLAKQIVAVGRTGVDVLNLSIVCYTEDGQPPLVLATAIDRLDPDIVVVAAAGNHGYPEKEKRSWEKNKPAWPAALDDVIAVGAAGNEGKPAKFTPDDAPWIDVWSNGVKVTSAFLHGDIPVRTDDARTKEAPEAQTKEEPEVRTFEGYATWSGSSFAAALVSGAIAAGTVPGRTSARAAWKELSERAAKESAKARAAGAPQPVVTARKGPAAEEARPKPAPRRPPFLRLLA
ncbi:S8 family peptidase [Blastococcus mobilis]|uniref:Subtilase family protein n=1 Tax=Blastococcus mobilis TaxID=1938746 RepID=A0A238USX9_9ACTN|nr:S8/S53 family peptidase [Blastococcus mobilis]SNR24459.1 Subtilase family protein [Blastococcus mobilis]